ncbi:MAG: hypothetical protein ABIY55_11485, partial [Kofleriaceae bacterium]
MDPTQSDTAVSGLYQHRRSYMNREILSFTLATLAIAACQLDGPPDEPTSSAAGALDGLTAPCAWAPTVTVTPAIIPTTPPGVPVVLDVAVTNPNPTSCATLSFELQIFDTGLLFDPRPPTFTPGPPGPRTSGPIVDLAGGATGHFKVTATAPASADAGDVFPVALAISDPSITFPNPPSQVAAPAMSFTVAGVPGCQVSTSHELMITNVSVVDDPVRTVFDPASHDPRNGVWTLKHLAENMATTPAEAPAMVEAMLTSFTTPQTINGFTIDARPGLQSQVVASWPRTADGALDLAKAPVHLQAIVNRFDLRDLANGDAGEGRFVFAFDLPALPPPSAPPQATIIFEYKLPATHNVDVFVWAEAFHLLGKIPFGERYNVALQAITGQFTRRGARPGHPNGSAINAVRTNEIPFGDNGLWELRELHLSPTSGRLEPATLDRTPDLGFNDSATLASYINANQPQIIAETHTVPALLDGQPFKAGAVFNDLNTWFAPGVDPS